MGETLIINSINKIEKEEWENVISGSSYATYFHCYEWFKILEITFPKWKTIKYKIEMDNENYVVALFGRAIGKYFLFSESFAPGVYGGVIGRDTSKNLLTIQNKILLKNNCNRIICSPFLADNLISKHKHNIYTDVVKLLPNTDPSLNWATTHKSGARKAYKEGKLQFSLATEKSEIQDYYKLYQNSLKKWGKSASGFYPLDLYLNLFNSEDYSKKINLWVAKFEGNIIAGTWILQQGNKVNYWQGSFNENISHLKPMLGLLYFVMLQLVSDETIYFDMGPSGGFKGVENFKEGFKPEKYPILIERRNDFISKVKRYSIVKLETTFKKSIYQF